MTEALRKTLKAYESTVECLEIELGKKQGAIKMLNSSVDGFSELAKQQNTRIKQLEWRVRELTDTIESYESCTKTQRKLDS